MRRQRELENENSILGWLVVGLLILVFVLAVGLAYERGHNGGYNEGWNDGRADGVGEGWQHCIEENNLYNRYGTIKMERVENE